MIRASAATQTVTKTVKFDMDGGQSGTTTQLDNYNIYSNSAGTLHWSCNHPNVNYILYSYTPENGRPGRTMLRGNLLQYEGTAEFCDIVGKVTKVEISNFRFDSSGVEMRVGQDRTNTSTLLHLEGTTNDFDYSSTDSGYGSVVFEGEVDVDKNNPLKIMLYPKEISNDTTAEFDFRGGTIAITYEVGVSRKQLPLPGRQPFRIIMCSIPLLRNDSSPRKVSVSGTLIVLSFSQYINA